MLDKYFVSFTLLSSQLKIAMGDGHIKTGLPAQLAKNNGIYTTTHSQQQSILLVKKIVFMDVFPELLE
jgi:hypothetical protein